MITNMIMEIRKYCDNDIKDVSEWLNKEISYIKFEFVEEDICKFKKQIDDMESSLQYNIDEEERVMIIEELLKEGESPFAIFVDKADNFILEGRHRVVAFSRQHLKKIPVFYVS